MPHHLYCSWSVFTSDRRLLLWNRGTLDQKFFFYHFTNNFQFRCAIPSSVLVWFKIEPRWHWVLKSTQCFYISELERRAEALDMYNGIMAWVHDVEESDDLCEHPAAMSREEMFNTDSTSCPSRHCYLIFTLTRQTDTLLIPMGNPRVNFSFAGTFMHKQF